MRYVPRPVETSHGDCPLFDVPTSIFKDTTIPTSAYNIQDLDTSLSYNSRKLLLHLLSQMVLSGLLLRYYRIFN
jgi:hypothetical protein